MGSVDSNIKADLHTHTHYSDGYHTPGELIQKAKTAGLTHLAITDHDNVDAIDEAIEIASRYDIELIPGTEISAEHNGKETHILAYYFDHKNPELLDYLQNFRRERMKRAQKIVEKLNDLGIAIQMQDVLSQVKGNGSVGRPHIAVALIEGGFVNNYYDAFNKFIGDDKPAYVKKPNISTKDAISLINRCGGLSFVAHPGKSMRHNNSLFEMIEFGIDGIEVVHPSHSDYDIEYFRDITSQYFLLESGGSDFHGGRINDVSILGRYYIPEIKITAMKNRLFKV
ncbi:MAG TPA: PHP domain-containing protein [Ignavibacteria bacterium]|nr:PHP domain-containing protein [Ignavibacteria bacterium]HRF65853.1 PHP domain-containing protein [Ignavibacteria bacterium]HRJ04525.1 PHP domain-containing protein [Ignavibacteria bacterium]